MGQKVNPVGFRLVVRKDWQSCWFSSKKNMPKLIKEDALIRACIAKKIKFASISKVLIERAGDRIRVTIYTGRPGVVIGRKGQDLDKLREELQKLSSQPLLLDVQEVKNSDLSARIVAENIALQLERRASFRRIMKKTIESTMSSGALGIKVQCSGRLGGAEIARTEWQKQGQIPLQTLRENIDYALVEAQTTYGKIGVKCWICNKPLEKTQK